MTIKFDCNGKRLFWVVQYLKEQYSWHRISVSVMYSYLAREIVNFI